MAGCLSSPKAGTRSPEERCWSLAPHEILETLVLLTPEEATTVGAGWLLQEFNQASHRLHDFPWPHPFWNQSWSRKVPPTIPCQSRDSSGAVPYTGDSNLERVDIQVNLNDSFLGFSLPFLNNTSASCVFVKRPTVVYFLNPGVSEEVLKVHPFKAYSVAGFSYSEFCKQHSLILGHLQLIPASVHIGSLQQRFF